MKKNIKTIIGICLGIIIGISTTVTAATVFNSKDIIYSSSATSKTNVKDSLDELYNKVGKCPDGYSCFELKGIAAKVEVGDYISMTPISTSYIISKDLTGLDEDQTINPSELNLWRVIRKNTDGTVDVVSEYISSKNVTFRGATGYLNLVGVLNQIAAQYTNNKYVTGTRHMGYAGQILMCTSLDSCPEDTGYETDANLVQTAIGNLTANQPDGGGKDYWLLSRSSTGGYKVNPAGTIHAIGSSEVTRLNHGYGVRPVLTLKASVQIKSGDGQSSETAYQLK